MREMKTVYHRFAWNEKIWINLKVELEAARNYTFVIASWKSAWKIRTDPLYKKSLSNNLIPNSHPISNHHHPTVFSKIHNSHFQIHSYYSSYSRFRITRQLFSIIFSRSQLVVHEYRPRRFSRQRAENRHGAYPRVVWNPLLGLDKRKTRLTRRKIVRGKEWSGPAYYKLDRGRKGESGGEKSAFLVQERAASQSAKGWRGAGTSIVAQNILWYTYYYLHTIETIAHTFAYYVNGSSMPARLTNNKLYKIFSIFDDATFTRRKIRLFLIRSKKSFPKTEE